MLSLVPLLVLDLMQVFPVGITLSDGDEIRIGHVLAERLAKIRGLKASPQTLKIERYLQTVGDRVAANASRHLHYRFRFDPDPDSRAPLPCLVARYLLVEASWPSSTVKINLLSF